MENEPNNVTKEVASIRRELDDLKAIQSVGQDSYIVYQNVSALKTIVLGGFGGYMAFNVTFTADHQDNAFAELEYKIYAGSVSPVNEDKYYNFEITKKYSTPDTKVTTWELHAPFRPAGTYNIYIYVLSFDTGVVSV
jgi:hypothetical protein